MLTNYFRDRGIRLTRRGVWLADTIEYTFWLTLILIAIGTAGGIEVGRIKLPWGF